MYHQHDCKCPIHFYEINVFLFLKKVEKIQLNHTPEFEFKLPNLITQI